MLFSNYKRLKSEAEVSWKKRKYRVKVVNALTKNVFLVKEEI